MGAVLFSPFRGSAGSGGRDSIYPSETTEEKVSERKDRMVVHFFVGQSFSDVYFFAGCGRLPLFCLRKCAAGVWTHKERDGHGCFCAGAVHETGGGTQTGTTVPELEQTGADGSRVFLCESAE